MKRILITVPNQHWIHKLVVHKMMLLLQDGRYRVNILMPSHKPYVNNLHHIVNDFINDNYDFWLNIDSDNPPIHNPLDLVELNRDVIGLPTPIWHFKDEKKGERPVYWNAYDYDSSVDAYREHINRAGLQKVDAIGTGCFLVHRRVFKNKELQKGAFMRKWNEDGTMNKGNDISFCERVRSQGFEIYCHYDYPCGHFSEIELNEVVKAFRGMYEGAING